MVFPPLDAGAVKETLTCASPGVTTRLVGLPGTESPLAAPPIIFVQFTLL